MDVEASPEGIPPHGAAFEDSVRPIVEAGHTQGHVNVAVASGGTQALLIGDAMHSQIQCWAPDAKPALDTQAFAVAARETRRRILERAAGNEIVIAGSHFPPPGFGRMEREGAAYRFVAVAGAVA